MVLLFFVLLLTGLCHVVQCAPTPRTQHDALDPTFTSSPAHALALGSKYARPIFARTITTTSAKQQKLVTIGIIVVLVLLILLILYSKFR